MNLICLLRLASELLVASCSSANTIFSIHGFGARARSCSYTDTPYDTTCVCVYVEVIISDEVNMLPCMLFTCLANCEHLEKQPQRL